MAALTRRARSTTDAGTDETHAHNRHAAGASPNYTSHYRLPFAAAAPTGKDESYSWRLPEIRLRLYRPPESVALSPTRLQRARVALGVRCARRARSAWRASGARHDGMLSAKATCRDCSARAEMLERRPHMLGAHACRILSRNIDVKKRRQQPCSAESGGLF